MGILARSAEKARLAPGTTELPPPWSRRYCPREPPYLILAVGTQKVPLSQPGDDGLGVPERHAGQGDAAAFLGLHVLRRCLREGGGSCGAGETTVTPSFHPRWLWGHGDRGEAAACKRGSHCTSRGWDHPENEQGDGDNSACHSHRGHRPRASPPRHAAPQPCPLGLPTSSRAQHHIPPPPQLHINLLLSKHGKTPQCRSKRLLPD